MERLLLSILYCGYAVPLSTTIARGFYRDGVWSDSGFMRWGQVSAVSWREDDAITLVLISHFKSIAQRLQVPGHLYGQARRVLRDQVQAQDIHIGGRAWTWAPATTATRSESVSRQPTIAACHGVRRAAFALGAYRTSRNVSLTSNCRFRISGRPGKSLVSSS